MKRKKQAPRRLAVIPTFSVTGDTMVIIIQADGIDQMSTAEISDALRDYADALESQQHMTN